MSENIDKDMNIAGGMDKSEQERKELNRKLIKRTFASEIKEKRKCSGNVISFIIDFIIFFVAFLIEEIIVDSFFEDCFWIRVIVLAIVLLCLTPIKRWMEKKTGSQL